MGLGEPLALALGELVAPSHWWGALGRRWELVARVGCATSPSQDQESHMVSEPLALALGQWRT